MFLQSTYVRQPICFSSVNNAMRWLIVCFALWMILIGLTYREPLMDWGLHAANGVEEVITVAQAKPGAAGHPKVTNVEVR